MPTARHLFGLKEILYDCPYENEVRQTEYDGFAFVKAVESTAVITLEGQSVQDLFAMTPYYWNTPADGAARLAECERLTTEIGFRFFGCIKRYNTQHYVGAGHARPAGLQPPPGNGLPRKAAGEACLAPTFV